MNLLSITPALSRLSLCSLSIGRNISTNASPLYFKATDMLLAEPLKKKKKADPAIIKARVEKKKRNLQKEIRKLEKHALQLKPILEQEIPIDLIDHKVERTRQRILVSEEIQEDRILTEKAWSTYKNIQHKNDKRLLDTLLSSQKRALAELKAESKELYQAALEIDHSFLPYKAIGPTRTPPITNYSVPDGEYVDKTRKFEGEDDENY